MKKLFFLFFISGCFTKAFAQYNPEKINKKAVALFDQAIQRAEDGNLTNAAGFLLQAIEADKNYVDAYLALAGIYGNLKNYNSSISTYEKAFALDSNYTLDYKPSYAAKLAGIDEFEKALNAINELLQKKPPKNPAALEKINKQKKNYEFAVNYAKTNTVKNYVFAPKNLGSNVNSASLEYFPSLTIDGSELVFTRRLNGTNEDFFSSKQKNKEWDTAHAAGGNINTPQSEAAQTLSADGKWMIYSANGRKDSYGNYDLYMSQQTANGWEDTYHFGGKINSDQWESQPSLSPDNKDLYFSSRRQGGYGGIDIYVSHMKPNGYFGEPENLGPTINTPGDDQCPFIHADNQTLYFTSNYWPGYGDDDLFYIRKQPNGEWGKPVNMGYPINTVNKEGTLFVASDGKTAYYASDRIDSKGGLDIYSFELPENVRPHKTLWVKGKVTDKKTGKGLASAVELIDLNNKQAVSKIQTDEEGNYFITLPLGSDYVFNVNRKGYLFYSYNFLLANKNIDSTYEKNIPLFPIETNASIVLKNIFFDVNKFELKPESQIELDKLVQLLADNPSIKIEISGHTDNAGKPADNLLLSNNRAKAVVKYLISKKVDTKRLMAKGYGQLKPIADNKTEGGKAQNRRTEMKVISK
jgi:outer membrane protein OmpA-like peptidoglycan-associated protein/tetratricopeptide (TPR) repeat protein